MIQIVEGQGALRVEADLPRGAAAYVDADWIETGNEDVPALVLGPGPLVSWRGGRPFELDASIAPDVVAARIFAGLVRRASEAVRARDERGSTETTGSGLVARLVGGELALPTVPDGERPGSVVETTGSVERLKASLERLDDLGTLVLAVEAARGVDLDLYADVHLRGLRLVAIKPPSDRSATREEDGRLVSLALESLAELETGDALPDGVTWFRVGAAS